jgi:hypothetical protein
VIILKIAKFLVLREGVECGRVLMVQEVASLPMCCRPTATESRGLHKDIAAACGAVILRSDIRFHGVSNM